MQAMDTRQMQEIEVILPSLNRRFSGVTATVVALLPHQARAMKLATVGWRLPPIVPNLGLLDLWRVLRTPPTTRPCRIWHARRNIEMLAGLAVRLVAHDRMKLVFTAATPRPSKALTRWMLRRMDAIIAVLDSTASRLGVPATAVVPHGIDCQVYQPAPDREAAWRSMGLGGQRGIATFGRVRPSKGTDLFVDAMIALLPRFTQYTAVVVGLTTPSHRRFEAGLRRRIAAAGLQDRIRFLGFADHATVLRLYQGASLVVSPSRSEGFGLTPIEAMACGTPVVASEAGAYPTLMSGIDVGGTAPCGDGPALIRAIERALRDPRPLPEQATLCRRHVLTHYTIQREAERINAVYRDLWA